MICFLLFLFFGIVAPQTECEICQDAMKAWHIRYHCAGNFRWSQYKPEIGALPAKVEEEAPKEESPEVSKPEEDLGSKTEEIVVPEPSTAWNLPIDPIFAGCQFPLFNCEDLTDPKLQAMCEGTAMSLKMNYKTLWNVMLSSADPWEVCSHAAIRLCNKADEDSGCRLSLKDPECITDILCHPEECTDQCYLCYRIAHDFPMFEDVCKPPESSAKSSSPPAPVKTTPPVRKLLASYNMYEMLESLTPPTAKSHPERYLRGERPLLDEDSALFQLSDASSARSKGRVVSRDAVRKGGLSGTTATPPKDKGGLVGKSGGKGVDPKGGGVVGLGGGGIGGDVGGIGGGVGDGVGGGDVGGDDGAGELIDRCLVMHTYIRSTPKARYFASWRPDVRVHPTRSHIINGDFWDPLTACKCIGKCELLPLEDLALVGICDYDANLNELMMAAYQDKHPDIDDQVTP